MLLRHLGLVVAGGLVGWLYDEVLVGALAMALALLAWQQFNLWRLDEWLRTGRIDAMPDGRGVWPQVFARIDFIQERSRRRRRRWRQLVRELRASAQAFPDGGVVLNARHEIVTYNAAARRLLGLKKRRDRGQRIENLIRHPNFVAYMEKGEYHQSVEIPAPAGGDQHISCLLIPYGPEQRLLLVRDITAAVRTERIRRDFVANASHELRTPLTVIAGYLDSLSEDESAPAVWRQPVQEMRVQAERMRQLLDDLLELSRLEVAAPSSLDHAVDMAAVLEMARKEALAVPGHPERVEVRLESTARLLGEASEIQSVVSNLVSNAVRYTPREGSVVISWSTDEEGGHLAVADTGIGIAADEIPRITERFYRTDSGRARQKGGTGLGLAIVKHALRRHEAELEVASQIGAGSTFTCHFPRRRIALS